MYDRFPFNTFKGIVCSHKALYMSALEVPGAFKNFLQNENKTDLGLEEEYSSMVNSYLRHPRYIVRLTVSVGGFSTMSETRKNKK